MSGVGAPGSGSLKGYNQDLGRDHALFRAGLGNDSFPSPVMYSLAGFNSSGAAGLKAVACRPEASPSPRLRGPLPGPLLSHMHL